MFDETLDAEDTAQLFAANMTIAAKEISDSIRLVTDDMGGIKVKMKSMEVLSG